MPVINITDLNNAKVDADHIAEVATSTAPTATDRMGNVKRTLKGAIDYITGIGEAAMAPLAAAAAAAIASVQSATTTAINSTQSAANTAISAMRALVAAEGYQVPVVYAAGIDLTQPNQTVSYSGNTYAPNQADLPFTTSGTFEVSKFRLVAGVAGADLLSPSGAHMVGTPDGTVQDALDEIGAAIVFIEKFGGDIEAAVNSLPTAGGKIMFGAGNFVSPYQGTQFGNPSIMAKRNVTFQGAGKPSFNSTFSKLEGGTVIQGSFFFAADGVQFLDLGIDAGKDYCDASNGGVPMEGLVGLDRANAAVPGFGGGDPYKFGFTAINIAILGNGTGANGNVSDIHALLLENYIGWSIRNISHVMGGAGLVIKSSNGTMDGAHCRGSYKYGVLNKSETYSAAKKNTYSNIIIENLGTADPDPAVAADYDTNGIVIEAVGELAEDITVNNLICNGVRNGVQFFSDSTVPVRNCIVSNFSVRKAFGYGVLFGNGYVEGVSVIGGTVSGSTRGIYALPATATNCAAIGCTVVGSTQYNFSNTAGVAMKIVNCLSFSAGIGHFGNTGGSTEFVGGFSVDDPIKRVIGTGGTVTGLTVVEGGTTSTGQPSVLTGPTSGSMVAGDYTAISMRVRNSTGGAVAGGDGIGVDLRAYQPGAGVNQAGFEIFTRSTSSNMFKAARWDQNGAYIQRATDTAAALDENRTMTFYWVNNSSLGVKMRGSDGVTRTGSIALT